MKKRTRVLGTAGSAVLLAPLLAATGGAHAAVAQTAGAPTAASTPAGDCPTAVTTSATAGEMKAATLLSAPVATKLNPSAVSKLAGGGAGYSYQVGTHRLSFGVPPKGFNPLTATNAQRSLYGIPNAPANPAESADWQRLLSGMHQAVTPDVTITQTSPDNIPAPSKPTAPTGGTAATSTSSIWSGYVSKQQGQSTYYGSVQGIWTQPSIGTTACSGSTHLTWVGLGGYGTSQLLQNGTDQNNRAWFEYLGPNGTGVPIQIFSNSLSIKAGDSVLADTLYGNGTAWWIVEDQTTGQYTSASLSNAAQYYDGSSAEFIDERTSFGCPNACAPSPLANYGATHWTGAGAATSSNYKNPVQLSSLSNVTQLNMTDPSNNNQLLANTLNQGAFGYTFETVWKNCK